MTELYSKPIKQEEWSRQYLEGRKIQKRPRPVDEMSTANVLDMIMTGKYVCDWCGKEYNRDVSFNPSGRTINEIVRDEVAHIINTSVIFCCDDCDFKDFEEGRVIAAEKDVWDWYYKEKEKRKRVLPGSH